MTRDPGSYFKGPSLISLWKQVLLLVESTLWVTAHWSHSFVHPRLVTVGWLTGQCLPLALVLSHMGQCLALCFSFQTLSGVGSPLQNKHASKAGLSREVRPSHYGESKENLGWCTPMHPDHHTKMCQVHLEFSKINKWWILRGVFYPLMRKSTLKCAKLRNQSLKKTETPFWSNFKRYRPSLKVLLSVPHEAFDPQTLSDVGNLSLGTWLS